MVVLGNRGRCAQPCRLPYTLLEKPKNGNSKLFKNPHKANNEKVLDNGYILSPRDLCSLAYIPRLIEAGVTCFKIEGRLKSPEYVATVTRIYRKYIDKVLHDEPYVIDENDQKELMQVFNRGGFSTGHLDTEPNLNLICKEKSNNMGLYLGNVSNYNKNKGYITLILNEKLAIGDTITFKQEPTKYTVSELMVNNSNIVSADIGTKVTIGRMKGKIYIGDKIYKLSSKSLTDTAHQSYLNCENKKIPLHCEIIVKEGKPVIMNVSPLHSNLPIYEDIHVTVQSNIIPEIAINNPITKERIITQISKTNNTPFVFKNIDIDLENNLHIASISSLNELRRMALSKIEESIISSKKRTSKLALTKLDKLLSFPEDSKVDSFQKEISLLLNTLNSDFDYLDLDKNHITRLYIPLKHFIHKEEQEILDELTRNFPVYIYMPSIIKNNYKNVIMHSLEEILGSYGIKGFVVSNLADFSFLQEYAKNYELIGNYTLNCFNSISLASYQKLGTKMLTLSPELMLDDIQHLASFPMPLEQIVYGNTPVMTSKYCLLGCSNKCYPACSMECKNDNKFYLRDRLGFEFRVIPDNLQTITTIYNSKTTCTTHIDTPITSLRIDILDESIEEINTIIDAAITGKKLSEGQYTYGNLNREV